MDMQVQTDFTQVLKVLPALRPLLVYIPLSTITPCGTIFWLLTTVFIFLQTTMMDKWSVGGAVNELGKRKCWALSISMKFYFVTVFMTSLMCGKISPACRISVQIWSFQKHRCIADVVPISNQSLLQADCVTFFSPWIPWMGVADLAPGPISIITICFWYSQRECLGLVLTPIIKFNICSAVLWVIQVTYLL